MTEEFGSSVPVNFNMHKVTLHEANGAEVKLPLCQCGRPSDTFFQGRESFKAYCNDCLYGKIVPAKFVYKESNEK
jgi:hypothetical protein